MSSLQSATYCSDQWHWSEWLFAAVSFNKTENTLHCMHLVSGHSVEVLHGLKFLSEVGHVSSHFES